MKISYDPKADALYIELRSLAPGSVENRRLSDDIILDYGPDGNVAGIEVLDASVVMGESLDRLTFEVPAPRRAFRLNHLRPA
jgi:uncharacterized protein YuzE